jgi:dTDP-4-dehydrorhamnose reductase
MRIFVAGAGGQLGQSLVAAVAGDEAIELVAVGRPEIDLQKRDTLARALDRAAPALVVNAAAYTAVDRAEAEQSIANAINCDGAGALAEVAAQRSLPIIHISTDYVFDGEKQGAYRESDPPNPQTVYGRSKLAGEARVAAANAKHIILRTAWIYSPYGNNFVKTMLRLAGERDELKVVSDQYGNPTYAADLAAIVLAIARQMLSSGGGAPPWGLYHAAGAETASWHGLAQFVVTTAARYGLRSVPVRAIVTSEFPTPARRPPNSQLDCGKLAHVFGLRLPSWRDGVERCVERLLRAQAAGR